MIIRSDIEDDSSRINYALILLESSGYSDPWREEIEYRINEGTPDDIELIIEDLLMNQVDLENSYRLKDINRRLDDKRD